MRHVGRLNSAGTTAFKACKTCAMRGLFFHRNSFRHAGVTPGAAEWGCISRCGMWLRLRRLHMACLLAAVPLGCIENLVTPESERSERDAGAGREVDANADSGGLDESSVDATIRSISCRGPEDCPSTQRICDPVYRKCTCNTSRDCPDGHICAVSSLEPTADRFYSNGCVQFCGEQFECGEGKRCVNVGLFGPGHEPTPVCLTCIPDSRCRAGQLRCIGVGRFDCMGDSRFVD